VPSARYFIIVGGTLAALLFIAGGYLPTPLAMFADRSVAIDRAVIRIRSAHFKRSKSHVQTCHRCDDLACCVWRPTIRVCRGGNIGTKVRMRSISRGRHVKRGPPHLLRLGKCVCERTQFHDRWPRSDAADFVATRACAVPWRSRQEDASLYRRANRRRAPGVVAA
jgi:hypothetical protein